MRLLKRLPRETARDYAFRIIKDNIIRLELEPGSLISENELAAELGLSRTPNTCDDYNIRGSVQFDNSIQILCSGDYFHIATTFKNEDIFDFRNHPFASIYTT